MTWTVRVVPEAEAEFEASARWYDQQVGSQAQFVDAIDAALDAIADGPLRYPLWRAEAPYRKYVIRNVPYVIYYRTLRDYIEILAFAHTSRRPGYWLHRR